MTIGQMLRVAIQNCRRNWKTVLLYGVTVPALIQLIEDLPQRLNQYFFGTTGMLIVTALLALPLLALKVMRPTVTTLPLLLGFTRPAPNGPRDFKGRFAQKFPSFLLLSLLAIVIIFGETLMIALLALILVPGATRIGSYINFSIGVALVLIPVILVLFLVTFVLMLGLYYSYIALVTEEDKGLPALKKGFSMLAAYPGRSMGHGLVFALVAFVLPLLATALLELALFFAPSVYSWSVLVTSLLQLLVTPLFEVVFTASMVELYRKNWLESHPSSTATVAGAETSPVPAGAPMAEASADFQPAAPAEAVTEPEVAPPSEPEPASPDDPALQ